MVTMPSDRPSRREALKRLGAAAGVLAGAGALGRALWDKGGFGAAESNAPRQVRDYRIHDAPKDVAELAIARGKIDEGGQVPTAESLVRKAVDAMGGIKRFVSRGDIVV